MFNPNSTTHGPRTTMIPICNDEPPFNSRSDSRLFLYVPWTRPVNTRHLSGLHKFGPLRISCAKPFSRTSNASLGSVPPPPPARSTSWILRFLVTLSWSQHNPTRKTWLWLFLLYAKIFSLNLHELRGVLRLYQEKRWFFGGGNWKLIDWNASSTSSSSLYLITSKG